MVSDIPLIPLTFGVELEFVFAINPHEIEADPTHFLYVTSGAAQGGHLSAKDWKDKGKGAQCVAEIFRHAGLTAKIQNQPHRNPDFTVWQVTYDSSVDVGNGNELKKLFPHRITPGNVCQWNHNGMEVVSRVLAATEYERGYLHAEPLQEVERFLTALKPTHRDPWLISTPNSTGLHVHMGTDPKSDVHDIRLPILQHLAYILARYEEIISSFHSDQRRGHSNTYTEIMANSNLMVIRGNNHCCGQFPLPALTEIQNKIFASDMTTAKLAALMGSDGEGGAGNRFKFVNWENLSPRRPENMKPRTLEFRQHEGTLSIDDIGQWVCFLTALMRTAEQRANQNTPPNSPTKPPIGREQLTFSMREGSKYKFACSNHQEKVDEFFNLLQLPRQATEYWMKRYEKYNPETFSKRPYSEICVVCEETEQEGRYHWELRDLPDDATPKDTNKMEMDFNDWAPEDDGSDSGEDQEFEDDEA